MTIARRVRWFLESRNVEYELLPHGHSSTSLESARAAHVPAERVAKCVLLEDEMGYLMAILPASCRIEHLEPSAADFVASADGSRCSERRLVVAIGALFLLLLTACSSEHYLVGVGLMEP